VRAGLGDITGEGIFQLENFTPFLVPDEIREGDKAIVWFVEKWAEAENFYSDALDPGVDSDIKQGNLLFADKLFIYAYYTSMLHVNLDIANTNISESWNYPYDPADELEPDNGGLDWRREAPLGQYVIADAKHYEKSSSSETENSIMILGQLKQEYIMYRLKAEVAEPLGLEQDWSMAKDYVLIPAEKDGGYDVEKFKALDKSTARMFMQKWVCAPPDV